MYAEHHVSHAAAAFYPSPFDSACILTFDGDTFEAFGRMAFPLIVKSLIYESSIGISQASVVASDDSAIATSRSARTAS